ncbi:MULTISPECIES: hypothetical protein [Streptomyces]|uniref:Uncharacterized protein n=2 Tax=Streptomyces TaxID=1883 RepID=A0A0W7X086_9ACTN|nr:MULTISPECIES: hypothetical protein [Streptomyces]KUF16226.1 hypothetical protein AT728_17935 [Streptomyces silvensis]MVO83287.1 hypothetical protein [Streptomyces typhae]
MSVDPTDPDTFQVDEPSAQESGPETPEADSAEQHTALTPERDDSLQSLNEADQNAADEADLAEQARVVSQDEDDYR